MSRSTLMLTQPTDGVRLTWALILFRFPMNDASLAAMLTNIQPDPARPGKNNFTILVLCFFGNVSAWEKWEMNVPLRWW